MAPNDQKFNIEVESNGLINLTLVGKLTGVNLVALDKWTKEVHNIIKDRYENTYAPVKVIIDIGSVTDYSPEAVTILTELLIEDKQYVYRSAAYGGNQYILMAQDMLVSLSGRTNFKAFRTADEAKTWVSTMS